MNKSSFSPPGHLFPEIHWHQWRLHRGTQTLRQGWERFYQVKVESYLEKLIMWSSSALLNSVTFWQLWGRSWVTKKPSSCWWVMRTARVTSTTRTLWGIIGHRTHHMIYPKRLDYSIERSFQSRILGRPDFFLYKHKESSPNNIVSHRTVMNGWDCWLAGLRHHCTERLRSITCNFLHFYLCISSSLTFW